MHDRAVAGSRRAAVARLRRRHAEHRRLSGPPRRRGRLRDRAGRRSLERGDAGGLARRGRRHRPRGARAGQAAGALPHQHRRRRPAPLLLLARQRAGAAAVRSAADARDRRRSGRATTSSTCRGSRCRSTARPGAGPAARRARHGPRPRRPHRLRHQFPHPRLAGPRRSPGPPFARRSRAPTSCWPRPRTSSCCSARTAWPSCPPAIRVSRWCSSWREPAVRIFLGGADETVVAEPVRRRRRHHGCRRQLRRRLSGGAPCRRPSRPRRRDRAIVSPAPSCATAARSFRARRCRPAIMPSLEVTPMTVAASGMAETRRKQLRGHPARRAGDPRHHHRARSRCRAARARTRGRRPPGARDHAAHPRGLCRRRGHHQGGAGGDGRHRHGAHPARPRHRAHAQGPLRAEPRRDARAARRRRAGICRSFPACRRRPS